MCMEKKKLGRLEYNFANDRYGLSAGDLWLDEGFHCGECMQIFLHGEWVDTRIEMDPAREWYLVGLPFRGYGLEGLYARI